jgi:predicted ATPase
MRIAFSGAACTGKTTTIEAFLRKWPSYKFVQSNYRNLIKKTKKHSRNNSKKNQEQILDIMLAETLQFTAHDKVVFDRCPLDNVIYSMWCYDKGMKGFTEKFIKESIEKVRESMRHLDIIFLCTRDLMPPIVSNGVRDTDPTFIQEIDTLFKTAFKQIQRGTEYSPFFPKDDSPGFIDIHGTTEERLALISLYVAEDGNAYGEEQSLVNMKELEDMYKLLVDQKETLTEEQKQKLGLLDFIKDHK